MDTSSPGFSQYISRWIIGIVLTIILAATLVWCFFTRVNVEGHSMMPLLDDSETVFINRVAYKFKDAGRYDVIYFSYDDGAAYSIKRIIGLPGENVLISNGKIYINGEKLDISYESGGYNVAGLAEYTVSLDDDEFFLLGDNGDSSEDSRYAAIGNVKKEDIIGVVWFRLSPFSKIGGI